MIETMKSRKHASGDLRMKTDAGCGSFKSRVLMENRALRSHRRIIMIALIAAVVATCCFCSHLFYTALFVSTDHQSADPTIMRNAIFGVGDEPEELSKCHSEHTMPMYGFKEPAVESTVVMLFSKTDSYQYTYEVGRQVGSEIPSANLSSSMKSSVLEFGEEDWSDSFQRVAAAFLTSPVLEHTHQGEMLGRNPFFDFFQDHGATFWTIENGSVATPMQLDVVYTYVNPEAPSFKRHLSMRNVPYTPERYNDWQELRYSFRALLAYALKSNSLRQHNNLSKDQQEQDRETLEALGYRVELGDGKDRLQDSPLIRRVYLVLSDRDQVPAWLNVKAFPMLRIVTHAELFTDPKKEPGILPTLNSNVIESGLHRIPGLSRYFLYINNDFMFSRQISFFDLFRPLSPSRQQLYTLRDFFQGACSDCNRQQKQKEPMRSHLRRRFVHLEPLIHTDSASMFWYYYYANDPDAAQKRRVQIYQGLCLNNLRHHLMKKYVDLTSPSPVNVSQNVSGSTNVSNRSTLGEVLLKMLGQPGWKTRPGWSLPDPHIFNIERGMGVPCRYYHHIMMGNFDGIQPPFSFPHAPQLINRKIFARMVENELHNLTRATRLAYEREMHPFSPVDVYGFFSAAMALTATREAWQQQIRTGMAQCIAQNGTAGGRCPEAWRTWLERTQRSLDAALKQPLANFSETNVPSFGDLGPVYGSTFDVLLQDPDLFGYLSFWWLPGMRPKHSVRRSIKSLLNIWRIPYISVCKFSEQECNGSGSSKVFERMNDQYVALLQEIFQHYLTKKTYRFFMVLSSMNAIRIASHLRLLGKARKPLWIGLNDNFEYVSDVRKREQNASFRIALIEATSGAPPAPWEK